MRPTPYPYTPPCSILNRVASQVADTCATALNSAGPVIACEWRPSVLESSSIDAVAFDTSCQMYLPRSIFVKKRGLAAFQCQSADRAKPADRTSGFRVQNLDHLLSAGFLFVVRIALNWDWRSGGGWCVH